MDRWVTKVYYNNDLVDLVDCLWSLSSVEPPGCGSIQLMRKRTEAHDLAADLGCLLAVDPLIGFRTSLMMDRT